MKRPLCVIGLTLALGTWLAFFFSAEHSLLISVGMMTMGIVAAVLFRARPSLRRLRIVSAVCLAAALAFALHALHEAREVRPFLRARGETVSAEGIITRVRRGPRTIFYQIDAVFPDREDLPSATMTLRCFGDMEYIAGDVIAFDAVLAPVEPVGFGVRPSGENVLEALLAGSPRRLEGGYAFRRLFLSLREWLHGNVLDNLYSGSGEVVAAMVLGRSEGVSSEAYSVLSRAGTMHLLSVSGLHLSILTAIVAGVLEKLRAPRRLRPAATIASAFVFSMLVGFSASIIRAFFMTAVALAAGSSRRGDSLSALGFSVSVICVVWPYWTLGKGFWLSAGATLGILLFTRPLEKLTYKMLHGEGKLYNRVVRAFVGAGCISIAASVLTLPLLILFNGWISLISPLANILVSPFIPVIMIGGIICAIVPVGPFPLRIVAWLTDICTAAVLRISQVMADLPFATAAIDHAWMLLWLAFGIICVAVLIRFRADRRLAAYAAALLAFTFCLGDISAVAADSGKIELVTISDCDTALLMKNGEAVLLGTPAYYEAETLMRYLQYRGVRRIQAIVAADCGEHIGSGLSRIAARYPVNCVVGPDDSYILGQLAAALPDIPVYSGGYADLTVFGRARIRLTVPDGDIVVAAAENTVLKSAAEYDIIQGNGHVDSYTVRLHPDGALVLNGAKGLEYTPVGSAIYGEVRLLFF